MKNTKALFTAVLAAALVVLGNGTAFAEGAATGSGDRGWIAIAAALAIAGAAIGAALGQGRAVSTAMESIGRNPNSADRIQTPMILGLAFIEALAIYALVIAFLLQGKI
ncbi:MAG: ATP synthase F0 subunit C [Alphaproteobacteria bacterium]